MSTYADDVTRTLLAPSPVDMLQTSIAPTFRWTKRCRQYPLDRMLKKQEHLPFFAGVGTNENMRRVFAKEFLPGNTKRAARYLIIWEPCCISRATSTWKSQTEYKLLTRAGPSWENFGHMAGWPDDPLFSYLQHWFTTPCRLDWKHAVLQKHSCNELTAKCCHMAAGLCAEKHVSNSCLKMGPPSSMHYPVAK